MRVTVRRDHFEMRLTLNLLTVAKLVRVDADADGLLSHAEITRAQEPLAACLREHLLLEVNQKKAEWNPEFRCELLWPDPSSTTPMSFEQYEGRNLDITLTARGAPLLQDFWIGFNIFELTGPLQTIQGVYEQEGRVLEVPFSVEEPEFTYDTGYLPEEMAAVDPHSSEPIAFGAALMRTFTQANAWWMLAVLIAMLPLLLRRSAKGRG